MITQEPLDQNGHVEVILLDRPEKRNALRIVDWQALSAAVREAERRRARALVITGKGATFCSGADLAEAGSEMAEALEDCFRTIRASPVPVIACVNGPAVGAGLQLAVSCDLRVVAPGAYFSIPAAAIGLPVHPGTIARIVSLAGAGPARSLLIGCERIMADRAYMIGLADRIGDLGVAIAWACEMADYAPLAVRYLKSQLQIENPPATEYDNALRALLDSNDRAEAVAARSEKRKPKFTGT